jgi:hypothetical protein
MKIEYASPAIIVVLVVLSITSRVMSVSHVDQKTNNSSNCCGCGLGDIPHPHSHDGIELEWSKITQHQKQQTIRNIEANMVSLTRSSKIASLETSLSVAVSDNDVDKALEIEKLILNEEDKVLSKYFDNQRMIKNYSNLKRVWDGRNG